MCLLAGTAENIRGGRSVIKLRKTPPAKAIRVDLYFELFLRIYSSVASCFIEPDNLVTVFGKMFL